MRVIDLTKQTLNVAGMITTTDKIHRRYGRTILERGEILFALRGEIGRAVRVSEQLAGANITRGIARLSPDEDQITSDFLYWILNAPHCREAILRRVNGSALQEVPINELKRVSVRVPPLEVQSAITRVLERWDRVVNLAECLIVAKKQRRKWLMQQLLTGKRRFPGFSDRWPVTRLGDVAEESTERNRCRRDQSAVRAVNKLLGMVPMKDRIIADDVARYRLVRRNWFAYNPMRINIGSICMWDGDEDVLVSPDYVVFRAREDRLDPRFLNCVRRTHAWERFVQVAGNGSVRVRIYYSDLASFRFKLPPLEEQERIVAVLSAADREIQLLQQLLAALREQKKGLMQQLLTGNKRLNGEPAASVAPTR